MSLRRIPEVGAVPASWLKTSDDRYQSAFLPDRPRRRSATRNVWRAWRSSRPGKPPEVDGDTANWLETPPAAPTVRESGCPEMAPAARRQAIGGENSPVPTAGAGRSMGSGLHREPREWTPGMASKPYRLTTSQGIRMMKGSGFTPRGGGGGGGGGITERQGIFLRL